MATPVDGGGTPVKPGYRVQRNKKPVTGPAGGQPIPLKHLPPPPPIGGTETGAAAAGVWDATPPDRTADTGSVDAKPYVPIVLGRGRVVFSIPFNDSGGTTYGMFVCATCEGQFDSWEKIWLNGNPMPGSGAYADRVANKWYADTYTGDGSSSWHSKVPLKTCGHVVVWLFGDTWRPWQSVWVTHGSSLDVKIDFAGQVKGELCWDPRISAEAWSENPALQYRLLHVKYKGIDPALMNDAQIGDAATACEAAGFTCNLTIASRELVDQAIAEVLATCNGEPTNVGGQIGLILDQAQPGAASFSFDENKSELMDPKTEWLSGQDRPTRVTVTFANSASNYKPDSVTVDDPGIALGTVQVNEKTIALNGITTGTAAHAIALQTLNAATVLERTHITIGWSGVLLSRFTKIHVKTKGGIDDDYLVLEVNEADPGMFNLVLKPYVAAVYGGTPITPPDPGGWHPPAPGTYPSPIFVTSATGTRQILSSTDSTHDNYDVFQLVEYVLPSNAPGTIDHLAVRGSEASDSHTKVWDDLASSETTITPPGNETATDDGHRNLSAVAIPVREATRVVTYSTRPTVLTDVTTEKTTRILVRSVNANGDLSSIVTVDWTAGVGPVVTPPPGGGGGAVTSPLIVPPSGVSAGQGGEIQLRELAASGTNETGFLAPDSLAADLRYVLPSTAPSDGDSLVPDSTISGYPVPMKPLRWQTRGFMIEKPAGVIDGVNKIFDCSQTPSSSRILCWPDGQLVIGGVDYGRVGKRITLRSSANAPQVSMEVAYPFGYPDDGGGTPEVIPHGTAATWTAETPAAARSWLDVAYSPSLHMFAAIASDGTTTDIMTSVDGGASWQSQTTPSTYNWSSIQWVNGAFFVTTRNVASAATLLSSDGVTWTLGGGGLGLYGDSRRVIYCASSGLYVAIEFTGTSYATLTTPAIGTAWTGRHLEDALKLMSGDLVEATDFGTLVAVGVGIVLTSADGGATWTPRPCPSNEWRSAAYSPELRRLVAVATSGNFAGTDMVMYSDDGGLTWTQGTNPQTGSAHHGFTGVRWSVSRQLFIAVSGSLTAGETMSVMTSTDGTGVGAGAWVEQVTPSISGLYGEWRSLACADDLDVIVVVGLINSTCPTVMRSLS